MEPLTLRERIILVFTNHKNRQVDALGTNCLIRLPTHSIDRLLGNFYTCTEIRKELINMEKDGYLHKCTELSRRGETWWRWDK